MKGCESYALVVFEQMPFSSPLAHTLFGTFFSFLEHHLYFYYFVMCPWYNSLSRDTKTWKPKVPHPLPHTWIPVGNIEAWGGRPGSSYAHRTLGSYGSRTPSQSPKNQHDFLKYHLKDKSGSKDHQENHEGENNSLSSLVPQLAWK